MALIYNSKAKGPGTHAFIVGIGEHSEGGALAAQSDRSAIMFATWVRQAFRNSKAPLATLEWLGSGESQLQRARQLASRPLFLENAVPHAFIAAFENWSNRLRRSSEGIGIFFFAGPTVTALGQTHLLLPASTRPKMIGLNDLLGMVGDVGSDMLVLVDAVKGASGGDYPRISLPPSSGRPLRPGGLAMVEVEREVPPRASTGLFARLLMQILEEGTAQDSAGLLRVSRLVQCLKLNLELQDRDHGIHRQVVAEVRGDFTLHDGSLGDIPATDWRKIGMDPHLNQGAARETAPDATARPPIPRPSATEAIAQLSPDSKAARPAEPQERKRASSPPFAPVQFGPAVPTLDHPGPPRGAVEGKGVTRGASTAGGAAAAGEDPQPAASAASAASDTLAGAGESQPPVELRRTRPMEPPAEIPEKEAGQADDRIDTDFVPDDAETERDELGRSVLAIGLARRLHRIWRSANEGSRSTASGDERGAFVVHLDSPWGGGKTTFANYLARVLDPVPSGRDPAAFLRERYGAADLGGIFLDDPPVDEAAAERLADLPAASRRPWIVASFNAWQAEHCTPPWWVFYEVIRKQCFRTIRREGDLAWRPRASTPAQSWTRLGSLVRRILARARGLDRWPVLVAREYAWRARNPKILALLATAAFGGLMLLLLSRLGAWGAIESKGTTTAGFVLTSGLGLLAAGLTGITGLWALAALFTESIVPGSTSVAERISLGTGDPFERFRRHFYRTIADLRRPVMVVIDDLDRCRPDFVVGLVRGMQTLLRSPRVVFVILGDRDWIERAFEAHHKTMEKVEVGPEQTFGARFVEKAIQMSFILPAMGAESRLAYVRRVLLGSTPGEGQPPSAAIDADTARTVREVVNRETAAPGTDPFDTDRILTRAMEEVAIREPGSSRDQVAFQAQVEQLVGETLAINATSSRRVEQGVIHQLEALAEHFPANPRQIKRIVNAITIYYAVALQRPDLDPDEAFRTQLALWIIIMTEWPETWRLLASFPSLVGILQSEDPIAAVKAQGAVLPGSPEATERVVRQIVADPELTALIRGGATPPLDPARVGLLAQLTPLHSRKRRLEDGKAVKAEEKEEPVR